MVQIAGKYEVVENKNFYELLLQMGVPEEHAKERKDDKSTLEVELDGNKIRFISDASLQNNVSELILNEEVEEKLPLGPPLKSTATLNGNVLTITSKGHDKSGTRIFTFSDSGLELKIVSNKGDVKAEASRIYKRI